MPVRKIILYSLLLPSIMSAVSIFLILRSGTNGQLELVLLTLLFLYLIWGLGVFIGMVLSIIIKKPKREPSFYVIGQLMVIVTIVVMVRITLEKELAGSSQSDSNYNQAFVDKMTADTTYNAAEKEVINIAYDKLAGKFEEADKCRLSSILIQVTDTTIDLAKDKLFRVYYVYDASRGRKLFSKLTVLDFEPAIDILNDNARTNKEFLQLKADLDHRLENVREIIHQ